MYTFKKHLKRASMLLSVIFLLLALSVPINALTITDPSVDSVFNSPIRYYSPKVVFNNSSSDSYNQLRLYKTKDTDSNNYIYNAGEYYSDHVDYSKLMSDNDLIRIPTASYWVSNFDEYYANAYTGVNFSYNSSSAVAVFRFANGMKLTAGEQIQFWMCSDTQISQTQYQNTVVNQTTTINPFLYYVTSTTNIAGTQSFSIPLYLTTENQYSDGTNNPGSWGLYTSPAFSSDIYIIGVGFQLSTTSYNVPSNYWWDTTVMFSGFLAGRIDEYFSGMYDGGIDFVPTPPVEFPELDAAESQAVNNLDGILNDMKSAVNGTSMILGRNSAMSVINSVLSISFISIFIPLVIFIIATRGIFAR